MRKKKLEPRGKPDCRVQTETERGDLDVNDGLELLTGPRPNSPMRSGS